MRDAVQEQTWQTRPARGGNMDKSFVVAAQLSTSHSSSSALSPERVKSVVKEAQRVVPLNLLIVGAEEIPSLYRALTDERTRPTQQVFLWYNLLSDYPGLDQSEMVVSHKGTPGKGWGGWVERDKDIRETFQFGCPNNPNVREKSLSHLEHLLREYEFDGVFLDKFRYPSPASGLDNVFTCFCQECWKESARRGLDLADVKTELENPSSSKSSLDRVAVPLGAPWLDELLDLRPALRQFLRIRADFITELVEATYSVTSGLGRQLSLDLFCPGLAPLVGQDYTALARYAAWAKPMSYRLANVPAGLRLEICSLARGLEEFLGKSPAEILRWTRLKIPEFAQTNFEQIAEEGVPYEIMTEEVLKAVELFCPKPVYIGIETVAYPGIIDVSSQMVEGMMDVAKNTGAAGMVMSWDLMYTPLRNLEAVKSKL